VTHNKYPEKAGVLVKTIQLSQGKVALLDDEDYANVSQFKWHAQRHVSGRWYAYRSLRLSNGKTTIQGMHRDIMGLEYGDPHQVDHKKRMNTLDNRRSNLRVTLDQNQQNVGLRKDNTSGYKGVSWDKGTGKWNAQIAVNRKQIHLGLFTTPEAARDARDVAALDLHGEFATTHQMLAA